jgi:hypothetical protein
MADSVARGGGTPDGRRDREGRVAGLPLFGGVGDTNDTANASSTTTTDHDALPRFSRRRADQRGPSRRPQALLPMRCWGMRRHSLRHATDVPRLLYGGEVSSSNVA